ncbi:unnamed protein product [Schistocephalus solidus]|uniref:Myelin basic protein n=1 Tax=Schistocephalus solidus TaxID=70667 RepID=A0A183T910_SCHSO|nr:unnamed protein product [Schistocephalus solidus]
MLLRVFVDKGTSTTLQGHSEDFPEATTGQPGKLGGPQTEPTGLEEDSEDWPSNRRNQPDRHRQGKKGGIKVTSVPDQHRQCPSPSNMHALSTDPLHAKWPVRKSSDAMQQQSDNSKFCQT